MMRLSMAFCLLIASVLIRQAIAASDMSATFVIDDASLLTDEDDEKAAVAIAAALEPSVLWHAVFQTAGYAGLFVSGVSAHYGRLSCDLLIGYVPESVGGEDLWSLTIKPLVSLHRFEILQKPLSLYAGISFLFSFDNDTFLLPPSEYPDKYYGSTAFMIAYNVGLETRNDDHSMYIEFVSLHHFLRMKMMNWDAIKVSDIVSLGFGYKYQFNGL